MRALLRTAMEEGAWGMSTGLDYPPGSYADTEELIALSGGGEPARRHLPHPRALQPGRPLPRPLPGGDRDRPPGRDPLAHHPLLPAGRRPAARQLLALVEDAREKGWTSPSTATRTPTARPALNIVIPQWAFDGGLAALRETSPIPEARARMKKEMGPRAASWQDMWLTTSSAPSTIASRDAPSPRSPSSWGSTSWTRSASLLLDEDQQVSYVSAGANVNTLPKFVSHPLYDGRQRRRAVRRLPEPADLRLLPDHARRVRPRGALARLPNAIRKMTSFPAQRLGLPDRGLLRDGFKADIVVFDAETVKAPATRREPKQFPIGIEHVIVNGQVVVDQGQHTGVLAGRALRRGRAST